MTVEENLEEVDKTRGCHVRYSWLKIVFDREVVRAIAVDCDPEHVTLHKGYAMRAYLLYLVGTQIFMDTSATYTDVM